MMAPKGTVCLVQLIHEHIFVKRAGNRIPAHKIIEHCRLSSSEIETVFDYLMSHGAVLSVNKTNEYGGLFFELAVRHGLMEYSKMLQKAAFSNDKKELSFADRIIAFGDSDLGHDLLRTVFSDPQKEWANDEVYESWGYPEDEWKVAIRKKQIYQTARNVNKKIQSQTGFDDFLIYSTKYVKINPKYI